MTAALKVWPATEHSSPGPDRQSSLGFWRSTSACAVFDSDQWQALLHTSDRHLWVVKSEHGQALADRGEVSSHHHLDSLPVVGFVPSIRPSQLGDATFRTDHGLRFAYVCGAMANGIASEQLVEAVSRAGMLSFFGSAGLAPRRVNQAIDRLEQSLAGRPFGINLIHSPHEPNLEDAIVDLYIKRGIHLVEASAYLDLTLPLVRYRLHGIRSGSNGQVEAPNRIIGKVSRVEVATKFFSPPPNKMVDELVRRGELTAEQAELARHIPVVQDLTVEADSGGHTDNRPMVALLPTMMALRDRMQQQYRYSVPLRVGAAGGVATPSGIAAAFAMGAAYVVTGSINQACVESGSSDRVRQMLAEAQQADVIMAPAADMFEMGVKVQVLKRGTMFAMRASKLFELYRGFESLEAIPNSERTKLERDVFRAPLTEIWGQTRQFWSERDRRQVERAESDPKHKMALVFRWYLGLSSRWANAGEPTRQADYQIWCGPAMGAFNEWTRGSHFERAENRRVADVGRALLHGAAIQTRISFLRAQGVEVPPAAAVVAPVADLGDLA